MPPLFILLFAFVGFGLLLIVLVKLISSLVHPRSNSRRPERPPDNLTTSTADDGFWVISDQVSPSTMLKYFYWVQGVQRMGQVPFEPGPDGRQFIYTGDKPDSLSVVLADTALPLGLAEGDNLPPIAT